MWNVEKEHNKKADWFSDLKNEIVKLEQQNVVTSEEKVKKLCSKMPNWKAPGHYGVQGFWIKRLDKMHGRIATQLNEILEGTKNTFFDDVRTNSTMSKGYSKGKLCAGLQTNNLSTAYVEVTYKYCFRRHLLLYGKRKIISRKAKGLQKEKQGNEGSTTDS